MIPVINRDVGASGFVLVGANEDFQSGGTAVGVHVELALRVVTCRLFPTVECITVSAARHSESEMRRSRRGVGVIFVLIPLISRSLCVGGQNQRNQILRTDEGVVDAADLIPSANLNNAGSSGKIIIAHRQVFAVRQHNAIGDLVSDRMIGVIACDVDSLGFRRSADVNVRIVSVVRR